MSLISRWLSQLESTRWLHNLSALISVASFVVATIDKQARPVLVHCSDGWDRTPQITTLAKLMLDSYYRTIEGFQTLVQREWLGYGHKFADRCGHGLGASDPNERSPVFLQWLDCIYQVFRQNPTAFEFNEMFLVRILNVTRSIIDDVVVFQLKLANHTYTCLYGTFLCNTDCERSAASLESRTVSLWTLLNKTCTQYVNPLFDHTKKEVGNRCTKTPEVITSPIRFFTHRRPCVISLSGPICTCVICVIAPSVQRNQSRHCCPLECGLSKTYRTQ